MLKSIRPFCLFALASLLSLTFSGCSKAAKTARHLADADKYYAAGDYDKAEIEYQNVLQIDHENATAIGRLGLIYFDQNRLGRVYPFLLKAHELQPDNLEIRLKLGRIDLSAGKMKEARDEAEFILKHEPGNAEAIYLLAETATQPKEADDIQQILSELPPQAAGRSAVAVAQGILDLRRGKAKEAEAEFEHALALDPKSSAANSALGSLALIRKDLPQADKYLAAAAEFAPLRSPRRILYAQYKIQHGDAAGGRRIIEELGKKYPDYLPAQLELAKIIAGDKKYPESAAVVAQVLTRDPAHPEALLLGAQLKLSQGDFAKAEADLERILTLYPRSAEAYYQLGVTYLATGQQDKALTSLTKSTAMAPDYSQAVILLASLQIRRGNNSAAIVALKQLLPRHPDQIQAWLLLADAYSRLGNYSDTLAVYDQVDKFFPGNPQTFVLRGLALVQQRKLTEARQAYNHALELQRAFTQALEQLVNLDLLEKKYSAAMERVNDMKARNPEQAGPWLLQTRIHLAQNDLPQAEAALRKAIELQPDTPTAYSMLARIFITTMQPGKALDNLRDATAKNPKDIGLLMMYATLLNQQGIYPSAREAYEKLLVLNPRFSPALNNLAYLYSEQFNLPDKALELAQKARELQPTDPNVADTLGWILYKQHQFPRALSLLRESAGLLPDTADIQFHLGMTSYMMGQEESARTALQHALDLDKNLAKKDEARSCLDLLALDADNAGARPLLEKALAKRPDDPVALVRLAGVLEKEGQADPAIKAYQSALNASPSNAKATVGLAELYFARKDTAKALELAKTARKLAPDDPEVAQTLGRLEYRLGEYQWAASLLQEATRKKTDSSELFFDEALALYSIGNVSDAESALNSALQTGSVFLRKAEANRMLEMIRLAANPSEADKQSAQIELILKSDPGYVPALMASGAGNEQRSDLVAARKSYEQALGLFPDFSPAMLRLAVLGATGTEFDQKTFDWALRARTAYPTDTDLAKALGILTFLKGDASNAVSLLNESLATRNDDAESWYFLGRAQLQAKDQSGGKKSLQRALELNLKPDQAADARKLLAGIK
jgi:tetratricopeptide (TPR) repeat protein